jgi:ABC-type uncharacterized transport system substrate-binding protein
MAVVCVALIVSHVNAITDAWGDFATMPKTNNGKKWRIGYYQGGDYSNYYKYLVGTINGLMDLGWIESKELPKIQNEKTDILWYWLSKNAKSKYIQFVLDGYYTARWDKTKREVISEKIINRLRKKKDIDLMIAMGTWAGKDLANKKHHTSTMVLSTSDPVGSGIIKSVEDSGLDHVHARVDPYRYERQVRIFHDLVTFKKLGVAYENSVVGRSYAAVEMIENVAKERHFQIVHCHTQSDIADQKVAGESVRKCFDKLAQNNVDAIYVTVQGGVNSETIPRLVKIANKNRIPTFSQFGSKEVKSGFLLSISRSGGFKPAGRFFAATAAQIFNGAKPRQLNQVFEEAQKIAVNLKTAEIIGFYLHADILAAADEIYREIED